MTPTDMIKEKEQPLFVLASVAFTIYRKSFMFLLPIGLAVYVPINLVVSLVPNDYISAQMSNEEMLDRLMSFLVMSYGLSLVFAPIAYAAAASVVRHMIEDKEITFTSLLDDSLFKWWKLALTTLIVCAVFVFGSFLLVPAIYAGVIFNFYICVIVASERWGRAALAYSAEVVHGRFFKTLGYICVALIVNVIFSVSAGEISNVLPLADSRIVYALYSALLQTVGIYFSFFTAVWYFNWERFKIKIDNTIE